MPVKAEDRCDGLGGGGGRGSVKRREGAMERTEPLRGVSCDIVRSYKGQVSLLVGGTACTTDCTVWRTVG